MSRYIDTDVLKEKMLKYGFRSADQTITEFVEDILPTVDVVEVVRCKDCKHAEKQDYAPPSCRYCCKYSALYHAKNFYCSMGERREDDKG